MLPVRTCSGKSPKRKSAQEPTAVETGVSAWSRQTAERVAPAFYYSPHVGLKNERTLCAAHEMTTSWLKKFTFQ